jgi:molecular chaperone DnaK
VTEDEKNKANGAIEKLRQAMASEDQGQIEAAMEELTQASHQFAERLYQQAGQQPGGAGPEGATGEATSEEATTEGTAEDVTDADFEATDEEKK